MAFERRYWVDGRAGGTLVNGDNLNRIEAGIEDADRAAGTALEQAQLARSDAQSALSAGVSDDAVAALIAGESQAQAQGDARWTTRNESGVSIIEPRFGAALDGTTDDSAALVAAVAAAKQGQALIYGSRVLTVPSHVTMRIDQAVDLRYVIDLRLDGRIILGPAGMLIVGHSSSSRPGQRIRIRDAQWADKTTQTAPTVRCAGMKQALVEITRTSHLELYADDTTGFAADTSVAYNTFQMGRVDNLTLRGVGTGWITENLFLGGDINDTLFVGAYGHNQNIFIKTCVEGGTIDLRTGSRNRWMDARCEAGTTIKFAAGTARNFFEDAFVTNPATRVPGVVVTQDDGAENIVMGTPDRYLTPEPLVHLDAASVTQLDGARDVAGANVRAGLDLLVPTAWSYVIDTGVFPLRETLAGFNGSTYDSSWRMLRFQIESNVAGWRPEVTLYDATGNPITTPGVMETIGGWAVSGSSWLIGNDIATAIVSVKSTAAVAARIRVRAGGVPKAFRYLRLTGYVPKPSAPVGAHRIRRQMARPLYQAAQPTQGVAHPGTRVQGPTQSWVSTARADSTLTAAAAAAATVVGVASAAGMAAGDVIGVLLSDGTTHWTTIASIATNAVTLTAALPGAAVAGGLVATTRWTARSA